MKQIYLQSYFKSGYNRFMNYIYDIAYNPKKEIIEERLKIIEFFNKHGEEATKEAFGKSRSTLYLWKQKLNTSNGRLSSLTPGDKEPKTKRKKETNPLIIEFIKNYRENHPGVGKETIHPELIEYCLDKGMKPISESTVGRIISDLKKSGDIPKTNKVRYQSNTGRILEHKFKKRKKLRRKDYVPETAGDLVQIDSITIFLNGLKRYIITAIDLKSRFAFAYTYSSLSSLSAKDFMEKFREVAPFDIKRIQTDNGSEFEKYFRDYAQKQSLIHFFNYPRSPKMNAFVERFNRTIQEQYVEWHLDDLYSVKEFNYGLMEYLLWYNTRKAHKSLNKTPPLKYFLDTLIINPQKSNMLWTLTCHCFKELSMIEYVLLFIILMANG